jgi:hypothetical protein
VDLIALSLGKEIRLGQAGKARYWPVEQVIIWMS